VTVGDSGVDVSSHSMSLGHWEVTGTPARIEAGCKTLAHREKELGFCRNEELPKCW
jgi:hypothetical protein